MEPKRFKPLIDKLFWIVSLPTISLVLGISIFVAATQITMLFVMMPVNLFVIYFIVSPLFGYAELREKSLFIKYGLILKKDIPYDKIRSVEPGRRFYSESMLSLKNSFEHVNIKYNRFDVTTVSVVENTDFIIELEKKCLKK